MVARSVALVLVIQAWLAGSISAQDDIVDVPSKQLSLADPNLSYFLIGPTASEVPTDSYGLIVVLPGGGGGPAAYAISLKKDSPVVGPYIAMSVFKPERLGSLKQAAGQAYFIDRSPQDRVCPFRMAQDAARLLAAEGARVKLNTYDGGRGWRGDVYSRISAGIKWLEENARPKSAEQEKNQDSVREEHASNSLLHDGFEQPAQ